MTAQELYEHFTMLMEKAWVEAQACGKYDFEDDYYKIHYNQKTGLLDAEYKGPPVGGADR